MRLCHASTIAYISGYDKALSGDRLSGAPVKDRLSGAPAKDRVSAWGTS